MIVNIYIPKYHVREKLSDKIFDFAYYVELNHVQL